jgi:Tfp pilus assembly protein PilF
MKVFAELKLNAERVNYERLLILLTAVAVFFIYAKTLTGDFIFDDRHNIRDNPHIRLTQLTPKSLYKAAHDGPSSRRPVAMVSFALNFFFHGYNVVSYHLTNILIHITNGLLLYLFIAMTWRTPAMVSRDEKYGWVAFFTAFIWLVHPIQSQSVSYIVQRMNSMATMFYLFSMVFYVKARFAEAKRQKAAWFSAAVVAGILALGSKEIAVTLPFFVILYEWYFFQYLNREWFKKRIPVWIGMLILLTFIALIFLGSSPLEKILSGYATHDLTMAERGLSQFRVVIFYISLLLWPHPSRLNLDHDFQPSLSVLDPGTTVLAIGAIAGFIVSAMLLAKKERLISFCILWYFGNLVIESSIIGLELIFEHRNYLPSMFFILAAVFLSYRYFKPKWLAPVVLSVVGVVFAFWTYERNDVWRSPILIWMDCIKKSPQNPRPYNNLGVALSDLGRYRAAADKYRQALQINPRYTFAYTNLGRALVSLGNIDAAIGHFNTALKISPDNYMAHNNLGIALALQERHTEAIAHFSAALAANPDFVNAHNNMGVAVKQQGCLAEAAVHFRAALRIDPFFAPAHNNLGKVLADQGRWEEAIAHFSEALRIDPGYENARKNLEESLAKKNQSDGELKK